MLDSLNINFNALHTGPLHLWMVICKNCFNKGRCKIMLGVYVGHLPQWNAAHRRIQNGRNMQYS